MLPVSLNSDSQVSSGNRPRILVVEDYWLVAMQAQLMLEDQDCEVVGPVGTIEEASSLAQESELSGAILDVSLGDRYSFPIAEILEGRKIPFAFATGYTDSSLPEKYLGRPHFNKPYNNAMVTHFLRAIGISPLSLVGQ